MAEITLQLRGAFPHQQEFLECDRRYAVVAAGTKSGKSTGGAFYAVRELARRPQVRGTWLAPVFGQATGIGLEAVRSLLPPELVEVRSSSSSPSLTLANGSTISFRSGDQPDSLFGFASDFLVVDEGSRLSEEAWNAVRSTLTATGGPIRVLTNPGPRTGWLYRLYCRGLDAEDPDVASFRWKTADNTLIPASEIDDARRTYTERHFRSLYMGEFLDIGGSVFQGVRECAIGALREPELGRVYVGGLDLARVSDWSVATVLDVESRSVVAWERWHGVSWEETTRRVTALAKRYNGAHFTVDSSGLGDPVLEQLERAGVSVTGVKFNSTNKAQMIEGLSAAIEKREVTFPNVEVLVGELESFEGMTGPTGVVRYSAPGSDHDDAVISLALAVWALRNSAARVIVWRPRTNTFYDRAAVRGI